MEPLRKIQDIDRFLLVAAALIFADLPQIALYVSVVTWPLGWLYGILMAFIFGFILNMAFNVHLLGPRMGFKAVIYFLAEAVPGIGALSFLSVAMFVISYFHNRHVDEGLEQAEAGSGKV